MPAMEHFLLSGNEPIIDSEQLEVEFPVVEERESEILKWISGK